MNQLTLISLMALIALTPLSTMGRHGGAIAGGVLGGLAVGAAIGASAHHHHYYNNDYDDEYYDNEDYRDLEAENARLRRELSEQKTEQEYREETPKIEKISSKNIKKAKKEIRPETEAEEQEIETN